MEAIQKKFDRGLCWWGELYSVFVWNLFNFAKPLKWQSVAASCLLIDLLPK